MPFLKTGQTKSIQTKEKMTLVRVYRWGSSCGDTGQPLCSVGTEGCEPGNEMPLVLPAGGSPLAQTPSPPLPPRRRRSSWTMFFLLEWVLWDHERASLGGWSTETCFRNGKLIQLRRTWHRSNSLPHFIPIVFSLSDSSCAPQGQGWSRFSRCIAMCSTDTGWPLSPSPRPPNQPAHLPHCLLFPVSMRASQRWNRSVSH